MELDNQLDSKALLEELIQQNSLLRLEIAQLRVVLKQAVEQLRTESQIEQSRNIPPEILERIAQLDIR